MIELTGYKDKHEYINKHGVKSVVYLMDNMEAMAQMGENEFSLACVDPPYGIGISSNPVRQQHEKKEWDTSTPNAEYFNQLRMVSVNQIIWGGNYFLDYLGATQGFLIWNKKQPHDFSLAMCEMAWMSIQSPAKIWTRSVLSEQGKIHPTQKPVALYDWIFHNYAKKGDTIFDSHLGSGSSRIAADKHNLPFTGIELDSDYFYAHCKRFDNYTKQLTLF
jgi:site-specific DNA-methyltransferase (adenine-specific)